MYHPTSQQIRTNCVEAQLPRKTEFCRSLKAHLFLEICAAALCHAAAFCRIMHKENTIVKRDEKIYSAAVNIDSLTGVIADIGNRIGSAKKGFSKRACSC